MSTPKAPHNRQGSPRRPSKFSGRRKDDIRPERKASVRKQDFEFDDAILDATTGDGEDPDADLSDLTDEDAVQGAAASSSRHDQGSIRSVADLDNSDESDSEMAAKLLAAGDGESLLGSGESDQEQEDAEEGYLIADAQKAHARSQSRNAVSRALERRKSLKRQRHRKRAAEEGAEGDIEDETTPDDDDLGAFSPETARLLGLPVVGDELFEEQLGFHSDSEPSFSDFFASDHPDDDEELTSYDEDENDSDSQISDLDALMGLPFLAHLGVQAGQGLAQERSDDNVVGNQTDQSVDTLAPRQEIPLLVIEDLDGRLIYARAGDGEAVFGSDGEFEFVDSEDEHGTDDELAALDRRGLAWPPHSPQRASGSVGGNEQDYESDGDTTDELPDEEMPFPRLLVGSVGPRGGRTSRRARAMAAHMRMLSPRGEEKPGHTRTSSNATDTSGAMTSPTSPTIELGAQSSGPQNGLTVPVPSSSSASAASAGSFGNESAGQGASPGQQLQPESASMLSSESSAYEAPVEEQSARPVMGSFMPSSSNAVHRAVVDGNHKPASPFTSRHSLQRRGLAGRRRPRQSSFTLDTTQKRPRRESEPSLFPPGDDIVSESTSSPETLRNPTPLPMDLDDVVDASMLWRDSGSSDGETADNNESEVSDSTAGPSRRSQSKDSDTRGPSDGFGLNASAFSRWKKIPMGAFREQQQGLLSGGGSQSGHARSPRAQQAFSRNYLLQRVSHGGQRQLDSSPFRRHGNHGSSSLHMVVPTASPHNHSTHGQAEMVVSPVLWPVQRGHRPYDNLHDGSNDLSPSQWAKKASAKANGALSRKMTKREKRERKAQRAVVRRAARAERQRVRNELSESHPVEELEVGRNGGETGMMSAPSTPQVPTASAIPDHMSPSKGMGMPSLHITEASPRVSPSASRSVGNQQEASSHSQHQEQASEGVATNETGPNPSGHTPPTHAVAENTSAVPSLPSATFGPPLASPLFGGLFAPLNMGSSDEHDLEIEKEGGSVLQI